MERDGHGASAHRPAMLDGIKGCRHIFNMCGEICLVVGLFGLPARSAGNFRIFWAQFAGFRRGAPTFVGWAFYLLCFW